MDMCKTDNAQFYYQKEREKKGGGGGVRNSASHIKDLTHVTQGSPSTATRPQLISRAAGRGTEAITLAA
jgi:hypothetical protein